MNAFDKQVDKKKDDEFSYILLGCGVFSFALLLVDIFVAKWGKMEAWVLILAVILHAATVYAWVKAISQWTDPNKDYWRKWVIGLAIAALLVILFHNAGWVENAQFWKE